MADEKHTSLSILTLPYPVDYGLRICFDFFAESGNFLEEHLLSQLHQLKSYLTKTTLKPDSDVWFEITMNEKFDGELIGQIGEKLGIEKFRQVCGKFVHSKMYIYEKTIK